MLYFSTNNGSIRASFSEAVLKGQPDDLGLYFPEDVSRVSRELTNGLRAMSNAQIAFEVVRPYVGGTIPDDILLNICSETVDFPFPLVRVTDRIFSLELFHGPTMAFKDVGVRFYEPLPFLFLP